MEKLYTNEIFNNLILNSCKKGELIEGIIKRNSTVLYVNVYPRVVKRIIKGINQTVIYVWHLRFLFMRYLETTRFTEKRTSNKNQFKHSFIICSSFFTYINRHPHTDDTSSTVITLKIFTTSLFIPENPPQKKKKKTTWKFWQ